MPKKTQQLLAFTFGVVFVVVLIVLAIGFPDPTLFQYEVFKVVLALAVGGVAAMIPGFLSVSIGSWLRAGGALAVFVIVYFFSPAELTGVRVKTEQEIEIEKPIVRLSGTDGSIVEGVIRLLPFSTVAAQSSAPLPNVTISHPDQLLDPTFYAKRYQQITIDGVRAEVPARSVLVANDITAVRGGALVGSEITVVARRIANLVIDASGNGAPAASPGTVRLFVKVVENTRVLANGAPGTSGLAGAPGANGADGANGRDGNCDGFGHYRGAGAGGNGADGGNGENGHPGTDGQPGGLILLTTVVQPVGSAFDVSGGAAGLGGTGGAAGVGGRAGKGGRGCVGLGGSQSNAKDGLPGRQGQSGAPGPTGRSGSQGEYRLLLVKTFDDIVAKIGSLPNDQLYTALASM